MTAAPVLARRCLWLGPLTSRLALQELPALSPAAVEWERGFLEALVVAGFQIRAVAHRAAPLWPRGRLFPGAVPVPADVVVATRLVEYLNAPLLRSGSLVAAYVGAIATAAASIRPDFVATFNILPWHLAAAHAARCRHGIPWISFLLDDVSSDPRLDRYAKASQAAAGHVLVSAAAVEMLRAQLPSAAILHIDGGIDRCPELAGQDEPTERPAVVYCGAHSEEAGMSMLVEAISLVASRDISFVITGDRGSHEGLRRLAARDSRVTLTGFVPPAELDAICVRATAFVNPRPPAHTLSNASFPSKLMRYLSFGKPIASTWTPGLAEDYRPLLVVAEDGSARGLAAAIERAIALDRPARDALSRSARAFMVPGRLWSTQAGRFAAFIDAALAGSSPAPLESLAS